MLFPSSSRSAGRLSVCFLLGVLAAALLTPASALAAKKLRWKFNKGDVYQLQLKQQITQKVTLQGRNVEIPVTQTITATWTVTDVAQNGVASVIQTIDRMVLSTKNPFGGEVKYDSASKEEPQGQAAMFAQLLKPMVGAKFQQKMSARGKVTDVVIPQKVKDAINANPLLRQTMSPDQLQNMIAQNSPVFPEAAMDQGHQWKTNSENKLGIGVMNIVSTFAYQGEVRQQGQTLDAVSLDMKLKFEKTPGATIEITDQKNKGMIYFDGRNGHLASSEIKQDVTMKITAGGQEIDQKLDTIMTLKISKTRGQ